MVQTGAFVPTGKAACYLSAHDEIQMPGCTLFRSADGFCATLAHELVHWSGAPHRLDRQLTRRFASRAYVAEEVVVELGAAFVWLNLARLLSLTSTTLPTWLAGCRSYAPIPKPSVPRPPGVRNRPVFIASTASWTGAMNACVSEQPTRERIVKCHTFFTPSRLANHP